ncbi:MAG: hypothetical protein AABZ61_10995, partial [Bacteroidota bacterium]
LVYMIRKLKPDVIITNHTPIDGHGNHQVVAIAAIEAFDAAADPTFAPEQLREEGVDLWQPKKLFWRAQRFTGERREPVDVVNRIGVRDTLRLQSYQEMALSALSMHKSQGMDRFALLREVNPAARTFYRLIRSSSRFANDSTSFFGGIEPLRDDSSLAAIRPLLRALLAEDGSSDFLERLQATLTDPRMRPYHDAIAALDTNASSSVISPLRRRTVGIWNQTLQRLAPVLLDMSIRPEVSDTIVVPGQRFTVRIEDVSPSKLKSRLLFGIRAPTKSGWAVEKNGDEFTLTVPRTSAVTLPLSEGLYQTYQSSPLLKVIANLTDVPSFSIGVPVAISIAPQQTLTMEPKASRLKEVGNEYHYKVHNYFNNKTAGRIEVDLPLGWSAASAEFIIDKEDGEAEGKLMVFPDRKAPDGDYRLVFHAHDATDTVVIRKFTVQVAKDLYVGIVKSYDNTVEAALQGLGAKFKLLDEKDLTSDLSKFTSVIVDIRAYLVREDLKKTNAHLLEYAKNGGNL